MTKQFRKPDVTRRDGGHRYNIRKDGKDTHKNPRQTWSLFLAHTHTAVEQSRQSAGGDYDYANGLQWIVIIKWH